ncbi:hypothetical protein GH733_000453 [Mirounga leonina]|nr:hypothetical protein GH733_000453 [Mirounga leonina]
MAGEPELHYFSGCGRMESIGWLLAAAGVEVCSKDRSLMSQQVPMVDIDGMTLVQTRTILNYMAPKYNLYGRDLKERALIDMYTEGMADLNEMIIVLPLCPPDQKDAKIALIKERTTDRYLPVFEKMLKSHGQDYLVGNTLSRADIHLSLTQPSGLLPSAEGRSLIPWLVLAMGLVFGSVLRLCPCALQALKTRISNLPTVKKFLQPSSPRKPPIDEKSLEQAKKIFRIK